MDPTNPIGKAQDEARLEGATLVTQGLTGILNAKLIPVIFILSILQKAPRLPADVDQMLRQAIEHLESTVTDTQQTLEMLAQVPEFWEWSRHEYGESFAWPTLPAAGGSAGPEAGEVIQSLATEEGAKLFDERIYHDNLELTRRCRRLEDRIRDLEAELAHYRPARPLVRPAGQE